MFWHLFMMNSCYLMITIILHQVTPSGITKFLTPYIKRVLRTVIFIISESPDHLLNQLIHRLAWGYWGFELTLDSEDLTARLQISFHVYLPYYIRSTYVYQMCLYKHECFMRLTEDFFDHDQHSRSLGKHLLDWNVLEPDTESRPAAGPLCNRSAWPPMSQRRDELKHKASINIKVHGPHQAVKDQTVNLSTLVQAAVDQTATHTHTSNAAMSLMISWGKISSTTRRYDTSERASIKSRVHSLCSPCPYSTRVGMWLYMCVCVFFDLS